MQDYEYIPQAAMNNHLCFTKITHFSINNRIKIIPVPHSFAMQVCLYTASASSSILLRVYTHTHSGGRIRGPGASLRLAARSFILGPRAKLEFVDGGRRRGWLEMSGAPCRRSRFSPSALSGFIVLPEQWANSTTRFCSSFFPLSLTFNGKLKCGSCDALFLRVRGVCCFECGWSRRNLFEAFSWMEILNTKIRPGRVTI